MAKRLISAGIATAFGVGMLALDNRIAFLIVASLISVGIVYEILVATKYIANAWVAFISLFFVFAIPFIATSDANFLNTRYASFGLIIALFVIMLFSHQKVKFSQVALVTFVSLCVPFSFSCAIFLFDTVPAQHRVFALLYTLMITFINDSGAFFAGISLGKHKMAPQISPKKTWEGFAGGILTAALFGFLLGKGYEIAAGVFGNGEVTFKADLLFLSLMAIPCALLGVLGDLSASILKRECAVKDFGNIMPGHGGLLDRFDGVLFVMPFTFLVFSQYFPITEVA